MGTGGKWFIRKLCALLLMSAAIGLQAEDNVPNRPLRTIRSESSLTTNHYPLSVSSSPLLSPENLDQPLTRHYIERYTSPAGVMWLNSVIGNGSLYLPYIREEIARRNLPPELAYLPFIESGYIGTARSRSGAVGLWQFMMNSIPPGMKVNDTIDERRDFRKSTIAALNKLEENYRALGNWPLALAAYNTGLGGVNRIVQRVKTSDYWLLCGRKELKTETIHYVPKLIAVSYILSNSRRYGVDYWPEAVQWTIIKPARQASLDLLASQTGTDRNLLHRLNQELLHGITPSDKDYELKVPLVHAQMLRGILEREDTKLLLYYRYQVKYGDTLSTLSRHYGVSLDLIEQHNPGILARYLRIGEIIVIPAYRETAPYTGNAAGSAPSTGTPRTAVSSFTGTHQVVRGDTLWSLAVHYRVDPQILAAQNNMELNEILSIGKILKVPIIE